MRTDTAAEPGPVTPACDLWQMRCCVTLAETLHFGRAAARLNMTQPPFSRQIAMLEARLGVRLFERDRRTVALTTAGRHFMPEARAILERVEHAAIEARLAATGKRGSVSIGYTVASAIDVLPRLVQLHRRTHPDVVIVPRDLLIDEQMRNLAGGSLDIAIVRRPFDPQRFEGMPVMRDRWLVAMPRGHRWARLRSVPLAALDGQPMVCWSPQSRNLHLQLQGLFAEAGVQPRNALSVALPAAILSMVAHGIGIAVVPGALAAQSPDGVLYRPLALADPARAAAALETMLVWRRDEAEVAVLALIETARQLAVVEASPDDVRMPAPR